MLTNIIVSNADIIIGNLLFWPVYIWICTIPYRMLQSVLNNA